MKLFRDTIELLILLGGFSSLIYYVANVESKIYRKIDESWHSTNNKINNLTKDLELHISEYKQQIIFNKELSEHIEQDIIERFEHLYILLNDCKKMRK